MRKRGILLNTHHMEIQPEKMDKAKYKVFFGAYIGWIFDYYEVFLLSFLGNSYGS